MPQNKSFSVFSNSKSKVYVKIKGKRKQAIKISFTQLAQNCCGGDYRIDCCHNHSHPLIFQLFCIPNKQQKQKYQLHFLISEFYLHYTGNSLSNLGRSILHAFDHNLKHTFQKLHTSENDLPTLKTSQIVCLWFTYMRNNLSFYVFLHLEFIQLDRLDLLQCSIKQCTAIQNGQQLKHSQTQKCNISTAIFSLGSHYSK